MKIEGSYTINAPRDAVWRALLDPVVLRNSIPGCETLTPAGDNRYSAVVRAGVGGIKAKFTSDMIISDIVAPQAYTLSSRAKAPVGFVEGKGRVQLLGGENGSGATTVTFSGEVKMGGALASIAARLFEAAAKKNTDEMFENLRRQVENGSGTPAQTAESPRSDEDQIKNEKIE